MTASFDWWFDRAVNVAILVLTFLVVPLVQWIRQMRRNELRHIAEGIERVREEIQQLRADVSTIVRRMDEHIQYHLERKL